MEARIRATLAVGGVVGVGESGSVRRPGWKADVVVRLRRPRHLSSRSARRGDDEQPGVSVLHAAEQDLSAVRGPPGRRRRGHVDGERRHAASVRSGKENPLSATAFGALADCDRLPVGRPGDGGDLAHRIRRELEQMAAVRVCDEDVASIAARLQERELRAIERERRLADPAAGDSARCPRGNVGHI